MPERPEASRGLVPIGVGVLFLALTVLMTVATLREDERARASRDWPTVTGEVTTYAHRRVRRSQADMDRDPGPANARKEYEDTLDWEYTYVVDGATYTGRRYGWGDRDGRSSFGRGNEVTVHYDPADPSTAVLNTDAGSTVSIGGILFGLVAGGYCVYTGLGMRWRAPTA